MKRLAAATHKPEATCLVCSNVRGLSEHLIELGNAAELLGNQSQYTSEHGSVFIRTSTIGEWLLLASRLEKVEIDTWKYSGGDAFFCETIADNLDDHSRHYTDHSTALTRFMFVCNALEETYRFIDHLYSPLADANKLSPSAKKRTSSLRAVVLIDDLFDRLGTAAEPKDFEHLVGNFILLFNCYATNHDATITGMDSGAVSRKTHALHLVRNLRNHVAHGTFPIGHPTDYGGYEDNDRLVQLLKHGCRTAALYIQIILHGFCKRFESHDYQAMLDANGSEFERFLERCNLAYLKDLHLQGDFALHHGLF
jgi:hypothetical protein